MAILPSADSRRVVSNKRKYVREALVNHLVKLAQGKNVPGCPDMPIAVDWETKQTQGKLDI